MLGRAGAELASAIPVGLTLWDNTNIVVAVHPFVINGNWAGMGFGYDTVAVYN
jgi:hypothetical protein